MSYPRIIISDNILSEMKMIALLQKERVEKEGIRMDKNSIVKCPDCEEALKLTNYRLAWAIRSFSLGSEGNPQYGEKR